jgi:MoaA/NifB/PqqE/SkfB family radical SAM enzyme
MMYTNGTLIDDETARRIGKMGNLMPAVSIEGMKEKTDARRGDGVFDKIVAAMERLRREKVFFGLSITATKENADEVLSDRVIDFYFDEMGANFSWLFQYMPIGRAITLDLLPTPEQRLKLWKRSWDLIRDRQIFISDFWNGGSASHGCIAAGRSGGYMAVCWNGDVLSCAFMPFSPANVNKTYAEGRTLNDIWDEPFFRRVREWQLDYGYDKKYEKNKDIRNWMMPCPMRDHFKEFHPILQNYRLSPLDENARDALNDPEYRNGLIAYNQAVADLLDPIWENEYLDPDYKIPSKESE